MSRLCTKDVCIRPNPSADCILKKDLRNLRSLATSSGSNDDAVNIVVNKVQYLVMVLIHRKSGLQVPESGLRVVIWKSFEVVFQNLVTFFRSLETAHDGNGNCVSLTPLHRIPDHHSYSSSVKDDQMLKPLLIRSQVYQSKV